MASSEKASAVAAVNTKIEAAVATAVMKETTEAQSSAIQPISHEVIKRITPIVLHATSNEPWYQSRVTLGAIAAVIAGLASFAGYSFDAEDQKFWVENASQLIQLVSGVVALGGGVLAWYGRWRARKPLGS